MLGFVVVVGVLAVSACGRIGFASQTSSDGDGGVADSGGDGGVGTSEVVVPAGPFMMGCNMAIDAMCQSIDLPYHQVTLSAFAIDRTEVAQLAFSACVTAGACTLPRLDFDPVGMPTLPVAYVDWSQAQAYCQWAGKRLPTEAEWEKAARGTDGRTYPWGETLPNCTLGAVGGCAGQPSPVGSFPSGASPYGALDMCGNVWEWVADWMSSNYYASSPAQDPQGPATGTMRVMRGGFVGNSGQLLRVATRGQRALDTSELYLGFRCARSLP